MRASYPSRSVEPGLTTVTSRRVRSIAGWPVRTSRSRVRASEAVEEQVLARIDLAGQVVGEAAVGEAHVVALLEDDDLGVLGQAPGALALAAAHRRPRPAGFRRGLHHADVVFAIVAYCLFGLGLACYATPSTDAALSNLPADQAGSGSGIDKMASSLSSAMGAAISLAVFTAMSRGDSTVIGEVVRMAGRTDNLALREAAMVALGLNLVFVILAILSMIEKQRE